MYSVTFTGHLDKKTDAVERHQGFDHVGLLFDGTPGTAELPFI